MPSQERGGARAMPKKKKKDSAYWTYPAVQEYQKEYNKVYYMANRKKIIADATKRNKENEEQIRAYNRWYYAKTKNGKRRKKK